MIRRQLYADLQAHLARKEITILTGARQVGKTTLLKVLQQDLTERGERVLAFNLDISRDRPYFADQERLLEKIRLEWGEGGGYVFIDEMQRQENAGLFLKGLYDRDLPYKFVVSGSGSLELKENIQESLTGRKRLFELPPVSFEEFVHHRTNYRYEGRLGDFFRTEDKQTTQWLREYLNVGGYPRILTEPSLAERKLLLDEIFSSYLERDISSLLNLRRPDAFVLLIKLLADRIGTPLNKSQLATQTGLSAATLNQYLWFAEKTFVIKTLTPFFRNAKKELTKAPEVFFVDLGLRNFALNLVGQIGEPHNTGPVFENFVYQLLQAQCRRSGGRLHYWRTQNQAEVDFVVNQGQTVIPYEVKYQALKQPTLSRSFRSFLQQYQPPEAYLINLSLHADIIVEQTEVKVRPFWALVG